MSDVAATTGVEATAVVVGKVGVVRKACVVDTADVAATADVAVTSIEVTKANIRWIVVVLCHVHQIYKIKQ